MSQDGSNRHYRTFKLVFCLSQSSTRVIDDCTVWKVKRIAFTRAPFSMCLFNIERWLASIFVICESYWCTLILFMAEYWAKISELFDFSLMALDPLGFGLLMERSIHQRETIKQQTRKGKTKKKNSWSLNSYQTGICRQLHRIDECENEFYTDLKSVSNWDICSIIFENPGYQWN